MDNVCVIGDRKNTSLSRLAVARRIVELLDEDDCLVSALGFISRDVYGLTAFMRARCFYCLGAMGSVVPLVVGISSAQPSIRVFGLEGDGSLLMNLGVLATLRRYGSNKMRLVVFDNGCYESTGGQPSQPEEFRLEDICRAAGLPTEVAADLEQVEAFVHSSAARGKSDVLVVKVARTPPSSRVDEEPMIIAKRFSEWLTTKRGSCSA
jgi:thiamine pyrophosphate-dependent acetolactate synthase large subunit-like protein